MVGPNDHKRFQENRDWTPRKYKNDVNHDSANRSGYYSSAEPLYEPYPFHTGDASAQRPAPGRTGKYTEVLRNYKSKQNFRVFGSSKNAIFSKNSVAWLDGTEAWLLTSGVTHLFDDMTRPIETHMREKHRKNTVRPHIHKRFQENRDWTTRKYKTSLATTSANQPGESITLLQNRSTNHIPSIWGTRTRSERPPTGPVKIYGSARKR